MMRYHLRTLLIVLAIGPLVIGWTLPPAIRAVHDRLWRSEPTQADFERVVAQLLAETTSRSAIRGGFHNDLWERPLDCHPALANEPSLAD
jgi:hypothetical protein